MNSPATPMEELEKRVEANRRFDYYVQSLLLYNILLVLKQILIVLKERGR